MQSADSYLRGRRGIGGRALLAASIAAIPLSFGNRLVAHEHLADSYHDEAECRGGQDTAGFRDEEHASERETVPGAEKARCAKQGCRGRLFGGKGRGNPLAHEGAVASQ